MINIKRLAAVPNKQRAEITTMLQDLNAEFKGLGVIAMEAIAYDDAFMTYVNGNQFAMESSTALVATGGPLVAATKNVSKAGMLKKAMVFAIAGAAVTLSYFLIKALMKFTAFAEKAKRTFSKVESVILADITKLDEEKFAAATAKVLKPEDFQALYKTTNAMNVAIKGFAANFTTKEIIWKDALFAGLEVTMADNIIDKLSAKKLTKPPKGKIGEMGWTIAKVAKMAPAIKNLISSLSEFSNIQNALKAEAAKVKALQKELKASPDDGKEAIKKQILTIKKNLSNFKKVIDVYYQLVGKICGQFFSLTSRMHVKK